MEQINGHVDSKILEPSGLVTTNVLNTKISKVDSKIPVSGLVKKIDYDA